MKKKGLDWRRRISWATIGLFSLQIASGFTFAGGSYMPRAAAFTPVVGAEQNVDGEVVTSGNQEVNGGTVNGATVGENGIQVVQSGGVTNGTVINAQGEQEVKNGGVAKETVVNSGGNQWIDGSGVANDTTVNDGGAQFVALHGTANDTTVNEGGMQSIQGGTANNTTVNGGLQEIQHSSVANNTEINNHGEQEIKNGGLAKDTTINATGSQWIDGGGTAKDTTVNDGGAQFVALNGTANDTTVNAGGMQSIQGGTANNTTLDGGLQEIQHTSVANNTVINNHGEQEIKNGGLAKNTTINATGSQWIDGGGTAKDTTVNSGGVQFIGLQGVAQHTDVNTGGLQSIQGGTANNTMLNGGYQEIQHTSVANNTVINNGGYQEIQSLGVANDTIITDGGTQAVHSNATANYSTAYAGGSIVVMENGANLTGTTTLQGGALRLHPASSDGSSFITAKVENLAGSGSIHLNTNLEALTGDKVQVSGTTSGNHQVFVNNQGGASVDKDATLTIIETAGGGGFTLGQKTEVGGYLYDIRNELGNQNNWELYSTGRATSSANASIGAFNASYLLNYAENQTLLQRMGDLRQGESAGGVWARGFGGKFEAGGNNFLSGFDMSYGGTQVGLDKKITLKNDKGNLYLGGMFGYTKGNLHYGAGSGSLESKSLGVYGTYVAPNGFYADTTLKYGWMKNDFSVLDTAGTLVKGNTGNVNNLSASIELGQRVHFDSKKKEGWYVEPQAQFSMGHQNGASFNASNGLRADVDSYNSKLGRLGVNVGYEVKSGKNPINVYAKASYVREFDGDVSYKMNGVSEQASFGGSWLTYGVGVTAQVSKNQNIYFDIERASGGKFDQPWSLNAGYRFQW